MRRFVYIGAAVLALIWLTVVIWAAQQPRVIDISGAHGTMLFIVTPAILLAAWGRLLPLAATLIGVAFFMALSVLVAGQISN